MDVLGSVGLRIRANVFNYFRPFQDLSINRTISSNFKQFEAVPSHLEPFQATSSYFNQFQIISNNSMILNHSKPFQTVSSHVKLFEVLSTLFQPIRSRFKLFRAIPSLSKSFQSSESKQFQSVQVRPNPINSATSALNPINQ